VGKRFTSSFESGAPVAEVFATLTGEDWPATKAVHLGDDSRTLRREVTPDGGVTLVVSRALPDGIPGFLQKLLPGDPRATQSDVWVAPDGDVRRGTWTAEILGTPARMGGTMRVEPTAAGSRYTIDGEVKVSVPLVGGKAEGFIAEQVLRLAAAEAELVTRTLGR
jgi:hypothetical protein